MLEGSSMLEVDGLPECPHSTKVNDPQQPVVSELCFGSFKVNTVLKDLLQLFHLLLKHTLVQILTVEASVFFCFNKVMI